MPAYDPITGTTLREAREAAHLSQGEAAQMLGVSLSTLASWERPGAPTPQPRHRRVLVAFLNEITTTSPLTLDRPANLSLDQRRKHATNLVHAALKRGDLEREPCEVCGAAKTEAHHDDYDQPLDVRWFCRSHHLALHAEARV